MNDNLLEAFDEMVEEAQENISKAVAYGILRDYDLISFNDKADAVREMLVAEARKHG